MTPMKITVVAFEGCMTSAVYGQADAFAIAAYIAGRRGDASWSGHEVRIATANGEPVAGYGGHPIRPHCSLGQARDSDVVLIPPIFNDIEATLAIESELIRWLKSLPTNSTLLASTCTGAFLLAEAGLLDGRRVTTNPAFGALFAQRYPAVQLAVHERLIDTTA
jgi:transcriptional regulator GlxA family with amidase domain